ncbi:MAG: VWA domain-containing protein [Cytophagaceae bacterium]|nr:VWA domain-containing protein [Cytophagaceae bacterium]
MYFNRIFSPVETIFLVGFLLIYAIYFARTFWFAYQLRTTARSVVLKFILRSIYFGLMIVALLEPSFGEVERDVRAVGRDVLLLVDVSTSMNAADVQPTRLEKIQFELIKLLDAFPSDRFGLIIFTSTAVLQCPLTLDHSAMRLFVESLNTKLLGASGTALAPALDLATQKLVNSAANQSKAVVLISDGEDFGPYPRPAVRTLRRNEIALFTVGVGTVRGARIPAKNGFVKDADGQIVVSRLQPDHLRQLARDANGLYLEVTDRRNDFAVLSERLSHLEGRLIDKRKMVVASNKYAYFLVSALVLLSFDVLITVRTIRL